MTSQPAEVLSKASVSSTGIQTNMRERRNRSRTQGARLCRLTGPRARDFSLHALPSNCRGEVEREGDQAVANGQIVEHFDQSQATKQGNFEVTLRDFGYTENPCHGRQSHWR